MPDWILKLARRLMALTPGRYFVILTVDKKGVDWTVIQAGKVER